MDELERRAALVAQLVRRVQSGGGIGGDPQQQPERDAAERAGRAADVLERLALDPLHDQIEQVVVFTVVEHLHHVRVADARRDASFVEEHRAPVRIAEGGVAQRLDGDLLAVAEPAARDRRPDRGHAAVGDPRDEVVALDAAADAAPGPEALRASRHRRRRSGGASRPTGD